MALSLRQMNHQLLPNARPSTNNHNYRKGATADGPKAYKPRQGASVCGFQREYPMSPKLQITVGSAQVSNSRSCAPLCPFMPLRSFPFRWTDLYQSAIYSGCWLWDLLKEFLVFSWINTNPWIAASSFLFFLSQFFFFFFN